VDVQRYSDGSYSTSDVGCRGDIFAVAPRMFPVPDYLRVYDDLRIAMREAVDACTLQQGACWVIRRDSVGPSCGQPSCGPCHAKKAAPPPPQDPAGGLAEFTREFRRTMVSNAARSVWKPVAVATPQGVAAVAQGCVLPFWQRIFFNTAADHFTTSPPSATYRAAVQAAMTLAAQQRKTRVVCAQCPKTGKVVQLVYVDPGGLVRAARSWDVGPTVVQRMDRLELEQAFAAGRGASLMPFNM
jgi:hypothetical protein